jgi:uncharacterized protein YjbI with pentapeptide repeats
MANLYNVPLKNAVQKVLANTLTSGETGTITFSTSVSSDLQASSSIPGILVIDRVDVNGNLTPALTEYISFEGVSGSTVTGLARGLGGTSAQGHSIGAIVEFVPDVVWADALNDVITTQHNADGTHKTLSGISLASVTINNSTLVGINFSGNSLASVNISTSVFDSGVITNTSLASVTLTTPNIQGKTLLPATYNTIVSYSDAATINLDLNAGNIFSGGITANRTFTLTNSNVGQAFMVRIFSSGGAWTPTFSFGGTIYWAGGSQPTLKSGYTTIVGFLKYGTEFDGYLVGQQ